MLVGRRMTPTNYRRHDLVSSLITERTLAIGDEDFS